MMQNMKQKKIGSKHTFINILFAHPRNVGIASNLLSRSALIYAPKRFNSYLQILLFYIFFNIFYDPFQIKKRKQQFSNVVVSRITAFWNW